MIAAAHTQVLNTTDALTLLLTVESLLSAALGVGVALAQPRPGGGPPFVARGGLALLIVFAITVVAIGAGAAWVVAYVDPVPTSLAQWLEGVALAIGIVAEAAFAWALWMAVR